MNRRINRYGAHGEINMSLISQLTQHLNTGTVALAALTPQGEMRVQVDADFNREDYVQQLIRWDII